MQPASSIVRQVLAQQCLSAAPLCCMRPSALLALTRLQHCSWPSGAAHLSAKAELKDEEASQAAAATADVNSSQQQQQQTEGSSSSSSAAGEEASSSSTDGASSSSSSGSSSFGGFNFSSFKSRLGGSSGSSSEQQQEPLQERAARLLQAVKREVADAVLPREEHISLTRQYDGPQYEASQGSYDGTTALTMTKQPDTYYNRLLQELHERFGHHPLFAKLRRVDLKDNPVYKKTSELADDLREKYETSDHPAVHKVEDVKEKLFGMSETATAMAKIRARDPRFDMSKLLQGVRYDAPTVVKAFLTHDIAALKQHIGPELEERMTGMFKHFEAAGMFEDPTILFTGEPELVELKLVDDEPLVVVQFACQQIKCTRDKFGNVVDGDSNSIQRVFYFWGLQQEEHGVILPDGRLLPPRWIIKDMMWQAHLALV